MKTSSYFYQKVCLLMIGLTFMSLQTFAQNIISGKVLEAKTNNPVIGASILIEGTSTGTISDVNGNFKLSSTRALPWNVVVTSVGYRTVKRSLSSAGSTNIMMEESEGILSEVVVSASRKAEKVQDAPASVSVLSAKTLQAASSAIDPVRELINVPGVQIQQQSAARINIEMRGSSSLFSTAVFPILDYRSLVGPGIGTFQSDASGINSIDLQRIEVVRGPASALYGPGVTAGVVHFMSKSPIDVPGTTVELMGGQLSTFGASIRHAMVSKSKKFGFKINAHYKKGNEFTLNPADPDDAKQIAKFKTQIVQPVLNDLGVVSANQTGAAVLLTKSDLDPDGDGNMMSNNWWNTAVNGTLEFRPLNDTKIFLSGGYNQSHSVYYNSQGEGLFQAKEYWTQLRFQKRGLFAQVFYVDNDGGSKTNPTFLYQTGNRTPIGRKQLEGQLQYNFGVEKFFNSDFTVGADYRNAKSLTEGLVYGRNENDDDYTIAGAYAQGKFELDKKLDLVVAGRFDRFNFIDQNALSPRIALVLKPNKNHTIRASFNRAFAPPSALNLYIDFPVATPAAGLFDVWLKGNKTGQSFGATPMIDLTAPGMPNLPYGTPGLPLAIPYGAVTPNILTALAGALPANIFPIVQGILTNPANAPKGTTGTFTGYSLFTGLPLSPVDAPVARLQEDNTFEVGYKGTFNNKLSVSLDVYRMASNGVINFTAISPTIKYTNTATGLATDLGAAVQTTVTSQLQAALVAAGLPAATATATANQIGAAVGGAYVQGGASFSSAIAPLAPIFGAVETDGVPNDAQVHSAAGYRTFNNVSYWGSDFSLGYAVSKDLSVFGNYSTVSKVEFDEKDLGEPVGSGLIFSLNIPKNKFRLGAVYAPLYGWRGNISFQHDDSFYANFGQYSGKTDEKNLIDLGVGYKLTSGLSLDLTCTNAFDQQYRAFPNMPKIGRRAIAKLTYTIGGGKK